MFAADYWIVLDDVQFTRRDYQHRARLAVLDNARERRWLSVPTHLPGGRQTVIREARIVDPVQSRRRTRPILCQHYGTSPHWPAFDLALTVVLDLFGTTDKTAEIAEASTRILLDLLGWKGQILHSSQLTARPGRSQRLADLAAATGARSYLCGTCGMKYLEPDLFKACGITVTPFLAPVEDAWEYGCEISALLALMYLSRPASPR
ncbi:WbqC family protein [Streptomyces sp. H39-C1]|uniref:WbqC family protein n=1 Tax=Streptomyces sp. H39-C1 TaxID=3004355 RepID=UPI0022AFB05D|nr:WbqC family protein [Streptomyces sp. H39-C1]MCZ4102557.1 WbqC family protein [Streptomyces sp. H39-C1]